MAKLKPEYGAMRMIVVEWPRHNDNTPVMFTVCLPFSNAFRNVNFSWET